MSDHQGRFVWYELMTTDPKAAERFYSAVVGWTAKDFPMGGGTTYTILSAGEAMAAGLMLMPEAAKKMGAPPKDTRRDNRYGFPGMRGLIV
jgi:hypothetical protein